MIVDGKPLLDPARFPENVVTLNGRKNIFFRLIIVQNMYSFSLHLLKKSLNKDLHLQKEQVHMAGLPYTAAFLQ